jgi:penicillin-binding protein 1A
VSAPVRVTIVNRASGNTLYWVGRLYGYAFIVITLLVVSTTVFAGRWIADETPATPDFRHYAASAAKTVRMVAADGTVMAEIARERREVVPYEEMPRPLVDAFVAIEDHDYWNHGGIYYKGILRAIWANLTAGARSCRST